MPRRKLTTAEIEAIRRTTNVGVRTRADLRQSLGPSYARLWMRGYMDALQILVKFLPDARKAARYNSAFRRWERLNKPGRFVRRTVKIWKPS